MESIIHHTSALKTMAMIILKPMLGALLAFGWWPTADFVIMQINHFVLLNQDQRIILDELKLIFGVMISFAVLIKILMGIVYFKPEKK